MTTATVSCDASNHRPADGGVPRRSPGARRGAWLHPGRSSARNQLLNAMAELSRESGWERVNAGRLHRHAGLSRRVFEAHFTCIEDCFEQAVEASLEELVGSVAAATEGAGLEWPGRVSAAIVGFLRFLDDEPARAWMSIVEPLGGGDRARFARRAALERLGALLGGGPEDALESDRPRPRAAPDVAGGLWEMARQYLWDGPQAVDLDDVAGSTIFLALSPYLGRREAMRYAAAAPRIAGRACDAATGSQPADHALPGGEPASDGGTSPPGTDPLTALTTLAAETLTYLQDNPGAAGIDVSDATHVGHPSQTSRHLRRLEELDLVWSRRDGRYKRWALTDRGRAVVERLRDC